MRRTRALPWLLACGAASLLLPACGDPSLCHRTGGAWTDCAATPAVCVAGVVRAPDGAGPAICEVGCTCPSDAPVWDAGAGCIPEAMCGLPTLF